MQTILGHIKNDDLMVMGVDVFHGETQDDRK